MTCSFCTGSTCSVGPGLVGDVEARRRDAAGPGDGRHGALVRLLARAGRAGLSQTQWRILLVRHIGLVRDDALNLELDCPVLIHQAILENSAILVNDFLDLNFDGYFNGNLVTNLRKKLCAKLIPQS